MTEDDLLQKVRTAWAEVLDLDTVDSVPVDTNFLEAGGDSLLLVMLWEQLQELTDRQLRMSDLFEHGTVRGQATLLGGADGTGTADRARGAERGDRADPADLAAIGAGDRSRLLGRATRGRVTGTEGTADGG